jgi:long-subunit fatty acid transport protein
MKALALLALGSSTALAGGMTLPVRGVRSLERAGALIAGADDADALWLDPAGLAHVTGDGVKSLLFDAAYVYQPVDFTPTGQATVTNQQPGMGVPTIAGAIGIGDRLVIGGGIASPTMAMHRYAADGPARRASVGLAGTQLVVVTAGAAYAVSHELRVGATVQDLVSSLQWAIVANGCPGAMTCGADDHTFDLPMQISQTDYLAPSGSIGVQYDALPELTLGATLQAPTKVSSTGTLALTLPTALPFANMPITGDRATTSFTLPPTLRAGIELRQGRARVEAAIDLELWSLHDEITIVPDDVHVGTLALQPMRVARDFKSSIAASLGGELHLGLAQVGAGIAYETAAAPPSEVSVLTVDASKLVVGLGGGYDAYGWQLGAAVGYVQLADVAVGDPRVAELAPLHDPAPAVYVNGGTYHSYYVLAGVRAARAF